MHSADMAYDGKYNYAALQFVTKCVEPKLRYYELCYNRFYLFSLF